MVSIADPCAFPSPTLTLMFNLFPIPTLEDDCVGLHDGALSKMYEELEAELQEEERELCVSVVVEEERFQQEEIDATVEVEVGL